MGEPKGPIVLICGINPDGTLRTLEVDADDYLKVTGVGDNFDDMQVSLEALELLVGTLHSLGVDELDVDVQASVLPTGAATSANQGAQGSKGWIGGAWQRQPMLLGFSDHVYERVDATSTGGASTVAETTDVPAGEIHVVNFISTYHDDPVSRNTVIYVVDAGFQLEIHVEYPLAQYVVSVCNTPFVLAPGDNIWSVVTSLANTKKVYMGYWGTRVDIDL